MNLYVLKALSGHWYVSENESVTGNEIGVLFNGQFQCWDNDKFFNVEELEQILAWCKEQKNESLHG
jgi:hypothetical protein